MNLSRLKTYHDTTCAGALRFMEDISQTMQFDRNEALLDVGCGSGSLTTLLSKRVGRVTALDVSPVMIDAAEKNNRAENITYRVADATKLTTFREYRDKFDKVVAYFVLQWMNDAKEALEGIHQSLKPGGQCFVNTTQHNPDVFDTVNALGTYTDSKWSTFMEGYEYAYYPFHGNADDYKQILAGIGFNDIDCTQKVFKYPFKYDEARGNLSIGFILPLYLAVHNFTQALWVNW
ncbi:malonyl-[acyl-carrier protein] O-methyltransferase-like isoform X2 [Ptychodera flava]|uniref:malonyl-[acyl-carrier protein] O-methyltransferase-like isoform X2 n=1 Tax=Ptychodera flava TaxID=63121 RepID=UPI00396A1281